MSLNKYPNALFNWHCYTNKTTLLLFIFYTISFGFIQPLHACNGIPEHNEAYLKFTNYVYDPNIKSIEIRKAGSYPSYPIVALQGNDFLTIEFDDISQNEKNYNYRVIHCDKDWKPSDLAPNEYLTGFDEMWIENVNGSFNTAVPYYHYEFNFPNNDMTPIISGNYLMAIYNEDTPESPIITARMIFYEQLVSYTHNVKQASQIKDQNYRQELDFNMLHPNYNISRPYEDIHQVILQNFNWHTAISDLKPMFVKNNELTYDYGEENTFSGLNEYRPLSFSSLNSINSQILEVNVNASDLVPELITRTSESRRFKLYSTIPDINGDFKIDSFLGDNDDTESEYCRVHFSVAANEELPYGKEVYIYGGLSFNSLLPHFKLKFNEDRMIYESTILLKQGFYNFIYVVKTAQEFDSSYFEGEHFQTINDFHIITYDSNPNIGYDRVIGILQTSTFEK